MPKVVPKQTCDVPKLVPKTPMGGAKIGATAPLLALLLAPKQVPQCWGAKLCVSDLGHFCVGNLGHFCVTDWAEFRVTKFGDSRQCFCVSWCASVN